MSDTAWNWVALGATVVLFAGLAYLSIRKKAGFSVRVLIATVLGIVVGIAFKGHTDYVAAFGSVWSNAIAAIVVPLLLFSVIAAITNLGESLKLRNIGIKTVVFLLINTFTAALITLVCILLCNLLHTSASHAIIGTLMILTPGIAFTMGIRDFVQGDYLSGTIRMIDALLIAASIAIGTGLVLRLYTVLTGVVVV